jgi:hypothetical protein
MKAFERIFLYTVLAILVFYVFLVDDNVESKMAIQEEITYEGGGGITVYNKDGTLVASMRAISSGGGITLLNKAGNIVAGIGACKDGGEVVVCNKHGEVIGSLP